MTNQRRFIQPPGVSETLNAEETLNLFVKINFDDDLMETRSELTKLYEVLTSEQVCQNIANPLNIVISRMYCVSRHFFSNYPSNQQD